MGLTERGVTVGLAILVGTDDLNQVVAGHHVPRLAADDIVDPRERTPLVPQALEVDERIDDPPAGEGLDHHIQLVAGGHLRGIAVPGENPFVEPVGRLHERDLEVEPRARNTRARVGIDRLPHRTTKLGDYDLFGLVHRVRAAEDHYGRRNEQHAPERRDHNLGKPPEEPDQRMVDGQGAHGAALPRAAAAPPRFNSGRSCFASSSSTIVPPSRGRSSAIVSR